ncbi:MAG: GAF domain-containing protein [Pseudomonadota bacterium]
MRTPSDQAFESAAALCAAEQVHIPDVIQSHGALIAVDNRTFEIDFASANIPEFLGVGVSALLSVTLQKVFAPDTRHALMNGLLLNETGQLSNDLGVLEFAEREALVSSCPAKDHTIFEFEPVQETVPDRKSLQDLEFLTAQVRDASDRNVLFEKTVQLLQSLTGYDRVMVYEFDDNGNGQVVAEAVVPKCESYLGLNFPSWDIPEQARVLMKRFPLRYIANANASQVPVLAAGGISGPLDMTFAQLRGASRVHMEYLRNMGTCASFTLSILFEGRLWGMISMHHRAPRYPSQRQRQICRSFAEFFALRLEGFQKQRQIGRLQRAAEIRRKLAAEPSVMSLGERNVKSELLRDFCEAAQSDGAALFQDGILSTYGLVPERKTIERLMHAKELGGEITTLCKLSSDLPWLPEDKLNRIAGLLSLQLPEQGRFFLFREARDLKVTWAGDPKKQLTLGSEQPRLHPRQSFTAYVQEVRGTCEPWTAEQKQIAEGSLLVFGTKKHTDLIRKTTRQQSVLMAELHRRVSGISALIRSLSRPTCT